MDRNARIERVLKRMAADGVDTLVAVSPARHAMARPDAAMHLSGYRSLGESALVLHGDGERRLFITPSLDEERAHARLPGADIVATDDLAAAMKQHLASHGNRVGRAATTGLAALPHGLAAHVASLVGDDAPAYDDAVLAVTAPKTDDEIAHARRAAEIAEQGFAHLLEIAHPGMRECDLAVKCNLFTKSLGANDNFLMLCAQPHGRAVAASSTRPLAKGDILICEFTPSYEGQFAQICRTASVGAPADVAQEKYALVVRAMTAGIRAVRPGIPVSAVCGAIDAVLTEAGYGEYCRPPHMKRRGHGLGCGSLAPGDIMTENETPLEADMVFVVHPNQYLPETGYLLCGEPVRVTATGVDPLTTRWAALGTIPA
jgi:Xaa-Pro aminopeptidase